MVSLALVALYDFISLRHLVEHLLPRIKSPLIKFLIGLSFRGMQLLLLYILNDASWKYNDMMNWLYPYKALVQHIASTVLDTFNFLVQSSLMQELRNELDIARNERSELRDTLHVACNERSELHTQIGDLQLTIHGPSLTNANDYIHEQYIDRNISDGPLIDIRNEFNLLMDHPHAE